jgi:hypothetical protein
MTKRRPPPKLTQEDRDNLGELSYIAFQCEEVKRGKPDAFPPWQNLPEELQARFKKISIMGLNAFRKAEPLAMLDKKETQRRVKAHDAKVINFTEAEAIQDQVITEQIRILHRAEGRND